MSGIQVPANCCSRHAMVPTLFTAAQRSRSAPDMQAKASMLVVGLANSGKTSIVQALKAERSLDDTVPTVGFSVERFHMLNIMLTVVDMSGQPKYQKLWECYYDDVQVRRSPPHLGAVACMALHSAGSCTYTSQLMILVPRVQHKQQHMQQHMQHSRHNEAEAQLLQSGSCGAAFCLTAEVRSSGHAGMQASAAAWCFSLHGTALWQFQLLTWADVKATSALVTDAPKNAAEGATLPFWVRASHQAAVLLPSATQQRCC